MKFVWEEGDIRPGRIVRNSLTPERWMIGYILTVNEDKKSFTRDHVIVSLSSGEVFSAKAPKTAQQLADMLTRNGACPEEYPQ